jgi:Lrp/AsnC family leucine-responsive transcriptional regulator
LSKNVPLSENDARVLEILQAQGRRSYADLGADLGMAAPSVHERVKKLEARGVIRGYRADVDPAAVGLSVLAFTWIRQAPGTIQTDLMPVFAAIPEIEECHHLAGEADYLLKIRARDMEHLGSIVKEVQANAEVFSTETDVAFTTGFERRALPVTAPPPAPRSETRRSGSA